MSRESIIKDLPEDYVRRMRNWARADSGCDQYAMSSVYEGLRLGDGYVESHMPVLTGEAADTHAAFDDVPNRFRQAVMLFWQYEGRSLRWLGRRLAVDDKTAKVRVMQGHILHRAAIKTRTGKYHQAVEANSMIAMEGSSIGSRTGSIVTVMKLASIKSVPKARLR